MKAKVPFIGITCEVKRIKEKGVIFYELQCDQRYPEAVKLAGGYPVLLPLEKRKPFLRRYVNQIDGLVIVGGDDVPPALYGEKKREGTGEVDSIRLQFEKKLYAEARRQDLPILGICYGMQLLNVLEGGTLFQDIRRDGKSGMDHRNPSDPLHAIRLNPDSRLGKLIRKKKIMAVSDHHQAVCRVAPHFRPVAFAPDGMIEAIESDCEKIFAVQWHPERTLDDPATVKLFRDFIRLC